MGRPLIFAGIVLDMVGTLFFVATLSGIGGGLVTIPLDMLICENNEMLVSMDTLLYDCVDLTDYSERDVTEQVIVRVVMLFMLALTIGIALIIKGTSELRKEQQAKLKNDWAGVDYINSDRQTYNLNLRDDEIPEIPPKAQAILQQVVGSLGLVTGETLADRLQQLEDAYQQGLITKTEYQRVRQAILDRMDD
ncbi:MAG: SHOCT domain-containing protein [Anaerolineae bacterium]